MYEYIYSYIATHNRLIHSVVDRHPVIGITGRFTFFLILFFSVRVGDAFTYVLHRPEKMSPGTRAHIHGSPLRT